MANWETQRGAHWHRNSPQGICGLEVLAEDIEDSSKNTTRFIIMAKGGVVPGSTMRATSVHEWHNDDFVRISSAKYPSRAVQSTRRIRNEWGKHDELESYMVNGEFTATQFYADIEGSPSDKNVSLAMEDLNTSVAMLWY